MTEVISNVLETRQTILDILADGYTGPPALLQDVLLEAPASRIIQFGGERHIPSWANTEVHTQYLLDKYHNESPELVEACVSHVRTRQEAASALSSLTPETRARSLYGFPEGVSLLVSDLAIENLSDSQQLQHLGKLALGGPDRDSPFTLRAVSRELISSCSPSSYQLALGKLHDGVILYENSLQDQPGATEQPHRKSVAVTINKSGAVSEIRHKDDLEKVRAALGCLANEAYSAEGTNELIQIRLQALRRDLW